MNSIKGYYSLIQFCPDPSRLEAVNVGVVLFCPALRFIAARTAKGNQRAAKLVGSAGVAKASLNSAKRAIERRLEVNRDAFQSLEDLQNFVDTRGNILKLTKPRPVKVFDPDQDLDKLFHELVGGAARHASAERSLPSVHQLDAVFHRLQQEGRAQLDLDVPVPVLGQTLHIPYAYRNGALHLVKPQRFSSSEKPALDVAMKLAIEGDLIYRHGSSDDGQRRLVVVSSFSTDENPPEVANRVYEVLKTYNVKPVPDSALDAFLQQVMTEAHQ
ncbi:MAG TPA: DUF3037 domain-containing protein [Urbifossiella sp.]